MLVFKNGGLRCYQELPSATKRITAGNISCPKPPKPSKYWANSQKWPPKKPANNDIFLCKIKPIIYLDFPGPMTLTTDIAACKSDLMLQPFKASTTLTLSGPAPLHPGSEPILTYSHLL